MTLSTAAEIQHISTPCRRAAFFDCKGLTIEGKALAVVDALEQVNVVLEISIRALNAPDFVLVIDEVASQPER